MSDRADGRLASGMLRLREIWRRSRKHRLTTAASSVAFYLTLGVVPGLAAIVSVFAAFASPGDVTTITDAVIRLVPDEASRLLTQHVSRLIEQQRASSEEPLLHSLLWFALVLWSANKGMRGLIDGLNLVYDEPERRSFFIRILLSLLLTSAALVIPALAVAVLSPWPRFLNPAMLDDAFIRAFDWGRWPAMLVVAFAGTALLLRFGPNRHETRWSSILWGGFATALLWTGASALFSWYVSRLAAIGELYGSLGSVVVFMVWLWLSALAVLIGAEIDASRAPSANREEGLSEPVPV
ncbi:MAG TPA: YihY/virulence factor BrkB family protein [Mesorhizobium sp.]|jgi:membrane protein|nr:YihY/virulence factor BrkB family protein [Mesorhizobium sp.]